MFLLGHWRNYEEMEEQLTLDELRVTLEAKREHEYKQQKFAAALKGVNLDEHTGKDEETLTGDDIKRRVEEKLKGPNAEALEWQEIGIKVIEED